MPEKTESPNKFLDDAISRAKQEILADITCGTVPADVRTFAELHDHVDANCYAGCCEDSTTTELRGLELWNSVFPRKSGEDEEVLGSESTLDAINEMQARLDEWLASSGHHIAVHA